MRDRKALENRFGGWLNKAKTTARAMKKEVQTLYLAYKHPEVPWYAKAFSLLVVGYALSPIDLIPDFIPVLGYLDDLVLIPLGVSTALKLIPPKVLADCREKSEDLFKQGKPKNWVAGAFIILLWLFIGCKLLGLFLNR